MKKFIRYIHTSTEDEQIRLRDKLNDLGFYVLTLPDNILEVNVIDYSDDLLGNLLGFIGGVK